MTLFYYFDHEYFLAELYYYSSFFLFWGQNKTQYSYTNLAKEELKGNHELDISIVASELVSLC